MMELKKNDRDFEDKANLFSTEYQILSNEGSRICRNVLILMNHAGFQKKCITTPTKDMVSG
nr:hypothetical protein [uncultured Acetobacterium sp.]